MTTAVRPRTPRTYRSYSSYKSYLSYCLFFIVACTKPQPATTTDDLSRPVAVPREIRRVVTLAPNLTEMIFALGAGDRIVGADDYSNYPAAARKLPKVGGMQPNIEKIVALKPDIVFASTEGNHPNLAPALAAANVPLFVIRTDRLAEIPAAMRRLASLLDVRDDVVRDVERAVAAQKRTRTNAPRVLFAVWTDPLFVAGRMTFTDDLYALTGARNAVEVKGWPQYSLESFAAAPPDLFLYPRGAVTPEQIEKLLQRVPGLNVRVVSVNEDIFQRPGPRMAEAAKALNAILDAP